MNKPCLVLLLTLAVFGTGCSTEKMAVRFASPLVESQYLAMNEEADPALAEKAIPSGLKLLEGLLKSDPTNLPARLMLAEGFCNYAFGFVEDDDPERASRLYLRGKQYAETAIVVAGGPVNLSKLATDQFEKAVNRFDDTQMQGLFWMSQCWSQWVMLNLHDLDALSAVSKLELAMQRVLRWDESYHHAGPHLFFGAFYGGRSKMLGGDPEKARAHFERNLELTDNKFLMTHYLYARMYAVQSQDRELFDRLLNRVMETPADVLPSQRLANEVAKMKSQNLMESADDYF